MSDIIKFNNIKISSDNKKRLIEVFKELDSKISTFENNNKAIIKEKFKQLFKIFKHSKMRVDEQSFLTDEQSAKFLDNYIEVCKSDYEYNEISFILEYVNLVGLFKEKILLSSNEYIKLLIDSLIINENVTLDTYPRIIPILLNDKLKSLISGMDTYKVKRDNFKEYVDLLLYGYNILEIEAMQKEDDNLKDELSDDFDAEELTIDRIYSYYCYQFESVTSLYKTNLEENNSIYKIILIKSFNNEDQLKFIDIVKQIRDLNYSLEIQLKLILLLVEIFLKLKGRIEKYTSEKIINILSYTGLNRLSIDESIDIVNRKI